MYLGSWFELSIAFLSQVRRIIQCLLLLTKLEVAGFFDIATARVHLGSFKLFPLAVIRLDLQNLLQSVLLA